MPTEPPLYGAPRPKSKSSAISLSCTAIHALSAEISLARSRPARRRRPPPANPNSNKNVSQRAARDRAAKPDEQGEQISERDWARSRRKLVRKARLYGAMKRGDVSDENAEGLVDFDRKWAEHASDESEDEEEDDGDDEIVEYEDEFGRTRKGRKRHVEKEKRREAAARKAAEEAAARDAVPEGLIVGNTIQTGAFATANFSAVPTSSMLSSALPPEEEEDLETHYDASKEVRTKGVGFYQFSTNTAERAAEMGELMEERKRTGEERKRVEEKKKRRREELEARREEVKRRRRAKVGESWLEGFMGGDKEGEGKQTE